MIRFKNGYTDERVTVDCLVRDNNLYAIVHDGNGKFVEVLVEELGKHFGALGSIEFDFDDTIWTLYRQQCLKLFEVGDIIKISNTATFDRGMVVKVLYKSYVRTKDGEYLEYLHYNNRKVLSSQASINIPKKDNRGRKPKKKEEEVRR